MKFFLIILFSVVVQLGFSQANNQLIAQAIEQNNISRIVQYFGEDTDVTVLDDNDSGKAGTLLVNRFFGANSVKSFVLKHEGTSRSGNTYHIGDFTTNTGNYRVTYFTKKSGAELKIIQFKIEEN